MTDEQLALPKGVDSVADLGTTFTKKQTADYLGISPKTVERLIHRGQFSGAHKADTNNGKTQEWRIPVAAVYAYQRDKPAPKTDPVHSELQAVRDELAQVKDRLRVAEILSEERGKEIERLHMTFRALNAGAPAQQSDQPRRKRGLFRKS
jgi:hypothetical protein